jgi:hypothetical protein
MNKIKRPTLATTKNCIMLMKQSLAECKGVRDEKQVVNHAIQNLQMALTIMTGDERYMENE